MEIAADISDVPEFHDCQRFITRATAILALPSALPTSSAPVAISGSSGATSTLIGQAGVAVRDPERVPAETYGALYAVFAAHDLDSLTFDRNKDSAYAAAEVYTTLGNYGRLGIHAGFSCLYMQSVAGKWRAWMLAAQLNDGVCKPNLPALALDRTADLPDGADLVKRLNVVRTPYPDKPLEAFPPVTRWDRDTDGNYYITMMCGAGWCDVGLEDAAKASPALEVSARMSDAEKWVRTIKGYYDEQALSVSDGNGGVRPQKVIATIIPDPGLENAAFDKEKWTHVGTIDIGSIAGYDQKLMLGPGRNEILVRGTDANEREYRVVFKGDSSKIHRVIRRGHEDKPNFRIPGVVRWRWSAKDEVIWARCDLGCCEVTTGVGGGGSGT